METNTEKGVSTTTIIGIVAGLLLLLAVGWYALTRKMPAIKSGGEGDAPSPVARKGNDYVSGDAINKRIMGNYQNWNANPPKTQYDAYWGKIMSLFGDDMPKTVDGKNKQGAHSENEIYTTAFMKGMNLAPRHDYVGIFKNEIQDYINSDARLPHWEVKTGQFLK